MKELSLTTHNSKWKSCETHRCSPMQPGECFQTNCTLLRCLPLLQLLHHFTHFVRRLFHGNSNMLDWSGSDSMNLQMSEGFAYHLLPHTCPHTDLHIPFAVKQK